MSASAAPARSHRRVVLRVALAAVAMFGFGYALVPLYDVLCEITGINGKTGRAEARPMAIDTSRTVTVELMGDAASGLPWEFRPLTRRLEVHPGQTYEVRYYVRNRAAEAVTGQAVPSVSPGSAAALFNKFECFCFTRQTLGPGEVREMPVRFAIDPALELRVHTVTLSYAFFNVDAAQAARYGGGQPPAGGHGPHAHAGG
jgi:cytochrome c oxidase assembly protein subunit 11